MLAQEYGFEVIDASADIRTVFEQLQTGISRVLNGGLHEPLFEVRQARLAAVEPRQPRVVEFGEFKESRVPAKGEREANVAQADKLVGQGVAKAAEGDDKT